MIDFTCSNVADNSSLEIWIKKRLMSLISYILISYLPLVGLGILEIISDKSVER
jgi:hypothetical protein